MLEPLKGHVGRVDLQLGIIEIDIASPYQKRGDRVTGGAEIGFEETVDVAGAPRSVAGGGIIAMGRGGVDVHGRDRDHGRIVAGAGDGAPDLGVLPGFSQIPGGDDGGDSSGHQTLDRLTQGILGIGLDRGVAQGEIGDLDLVLSLVGNGPVDGFDQVAGKAGTIRIQDL